MIHLTEIEIDSLVELDEAIKNKTPIPTNIHELVNKGYVDVRGDKYVIKEDVRMVLLYCRNGKFFQRFFK